MANNLSNSTKISVVEGAAAAGQTALTSDAIDMANWEGVRFLTAFGAITSGGVQSVKLQQANDSGGSPDDFSDIEGSSVTVADDDDGQVVVHDVWRPTKRYVRAIVSRATQDSVLSVIIAETYGPRVLPTTDDTATVVARRLLTSPAEGTA